MRLLLEYPPIRWAFVLLCAIGLIHMVSMLTLDRTMEYTEITYRSPKVTPALDGYTIAFLSDIHDYPHAKLRAVVERINGRGVDLVLMGGDMPSREALTQCMQILSGINATDGFYGVEGNHDNYLTLGNAMTAQGMTLLENEGALVRPGLYIAGVEDLWRRYPDVEAALAGAAEEDFTLLLAHNADASMERDVSRVDLMLSGHSHGGQISFFGIWAPAAFLESHYGQRFVSGWCKSAWGTDVFVGRGIGSHPAFLPRIFARPQVVYLTLRGN